MLEEFPYRLELRIVDLRSGKRAKDEGLKAAGRAGWVVLVELHVALQE